MTSPVRGPKFDDSGGGGDVIHGEEGVGDNLQQLQVSYAGASSLVTETMLSMIFQKTDPTATYALSYHDIAKVVYNILKIPPGKLRGFSDASFRRLRIWIDPSLNKEDYMTNTAVFVRPGLRLEPMKKGNTEFWVKIQWTEYEKSIDGPLEEVLKKFGNLMTKIEHQTVGPSTNELVDMMRDVKTNNRKVKMSLRRHIPGYILVSGQKYRVTYAGQVKSCPRCLENENYCKGKADPKLCEERQGEKNSIRNMWERMVETSPEMPMSEEVKPDYFEMVGFVGDDGQEDVPKETVLNFVRNVTGIIIEEEDCLKAVGKGVWRVRNVPQDSVMLMLRELNGMRFSRMFVKVTPCTGDIMDGLQTTEEETRQEDLASIRHSSGDNSEGGGGAAGGGSGDKAGDNDREGEGGGGGGDGDDDGRDQEQRPPTEQQNSDQLSQDMSLGLASSEDQDEISENLGLASSEVQDSSEKVLRKTTDDNQQSPGLDCSEDQDITDDEEIGGSPELSERVIRSRGEPSKAIRSREKSKPTAVVRPSMSSSGSDGSVEELYACIASAPTVTRPGMDDLEVEVEGNLHQPREVNLQPVAVSLRGGAGMDDMAQNREVNQSLGAERRNRADELTGALKFILSRNPVANTYKMEKSFEETSNSRPSRSVFKEPSQKTKSGSMPTRTPVRTRSRSSRNSVDSRKRKLLSPTTIPQTPVKELTRNIEKRIKNDLETAKKKVKAKKKIESDDEDFVSGSLVTYCNPNMKISKSSKAAAGKKMTSSSNDP